MAAKILVVEDEEYFSEVIRDTLEVSGYTSSAAYDVPTAIYMLEKNTPDLIISDMNLPGGKTVDILEAVKVLPAVVPVILITAGRKDELDTDFKDFYNNKIDIFYKPFDFKELLRRMEELINS